MDTLNKRAGLPAEVLSEFPILRSVGITLLVLVILAFGLRLYVKLGILKTFRNDDIALVLAVLSFIPLGVIAPLFGVYGARLNRGDFSIIPAISMAARIFNSVYVLCATLCKLSVLLLILSLLGPRDRKLRLIAYFITSISVILGIIFFAFCFTCGVTDIQRLNTGTCHLYDAANGVSLAWSFSNTIADIVYAALCATLIWNATMSFPTRITTSFLLSFSSVGAIASALRVATILGWGWTTFDGQRLHVTRWSLIEAGICIIAICLASTRPLLKKISGQDSSIGTGGQYGQYGQASASKGRGMSKGHGTQHGDEIPLKIGVQTIVEVEQIDGGEGRGEGRRGNSVSVGV
ncbi:hypothetical protein KVT40_002050 [Elsinoe batatas]|uniref:Rhodopsin domain-containing protein n=1 Tax=Elsinoe batatas TaxID=2601811 RepID=A0A8K0L5R8_9PEZI|nr:hypothetical protein KVT40_002050 [Elsinoe batatas]